MGSFEVNEGKDYVDDALIRQVMKAEHSPVTVKNVRTGRNERVNINWNIVKKLCLMQSTDKEICQFIGIPFRALKRACEIRFGVEYREVADNWRGMGKCSLRRKQWQLADKNASMAMFLGKNYLDQRDRVDIEHSGETNIVVQQFGTGKIIKWEDEMKAGGTEWVKEHNPELDIDRGDDDKRLLPGFGDADGDSDDESTEYDEMDKEQNVEINTHKTLRDPEHPGRVYITDKNRNEMEDIFNG